ncbi:MAG TPA: drug:proton antiporter, partial [Bacteroidota bacterium]|nr:drug:proton antiporter [Bacteroidota bacterium]
GSFGVAIIGTMLTRRVIYHSAMFGQAVNAQSPEFSRAAAALAHHAQVTVGGNVAEAAMRAKALLGVHLSQQAFVQAINDDFLIAAAITIVGVIPIFFLRSKKRAPAIGPKPVALD